MSSLPLSLEQDAKKKQWMAIQNQVAQQAIVSDDACPFALPAGNLDQWLAVATTVAGDSAVKLLSKTEKCLPPLTTVGGVDISFIKGTNIAVASVVVMSFPELEVLRTVMHHCEMQEPYIPGFLAFRELPPIMEALAQLRHVCSAAEFPQLLLLDGNGVHHMRRCGVATHLGVVCGIPTIGCAKKFLAVDGLSRDEVHQRFASFVGAGRGTVMPLHGESGQLWCHMALTGKSTVRPVFISPGHLLSFSTATTLALLMTRNRVVEPVRQADLQSRAYIRGHLASLLSEFPVGKALIAQIEGALPQPDDEDDGDDHHYELGAAV
jgi:deoxyinosine 3'endonuclease (endonuclease V)